MNHSCRHLPKILWILLLTLVVMVTMTAAVTAQTLRVGLVPEHDIFTQKKRYTPLFDYLGQRLGLSFELQVLPRHGMVGDLLANKELDVAVLCALSAAMAIESADFLPLARPHYTEGLASDYGVIFVRRLGTIRSAEDMRNKSVVFVDQASATGYLLALNYFNEMGIDDYRTWFADVYFAGTHEDTIFEVLKGHADVGVTKSSVFYRIASTHPEILERLEILASSPHVPAITLGVSADLSTEIVILLQEELLNMHQSVAGRTLLEEFGVQRFLPTTRDDFQPIRHTAEQLGIDLADDPYAPK